MHLLRRKPVEAAIADAGDPDRHLKRTLTAWDLAVLGVAVAVGAGLFSVGANAAATMAGPSVIISFVIAALVCALAMMCYAEFAASIPVAGSAYTYTYTALGEILAWIIGWDLILEMFCASAVIAKYWGVYLQDAFTLFGVPIPTTVHLGSLALDWGPVLIVGIFTALLAVGTKLSTRVSSVFTVIKVGITLFVVIIGFSYVRMANYRPFIPPAEPTEGASGLAQSLLSFISGAQPTMYGIFGLLSAAALVFFAFIGFDVVATTAEEVKNPQKTLPRGIFGGLAIVTVLYILVTLVVTGMVSYKDLAAASDSPSLTTAFILVGADWAGEVISVGILIGLTTVIMVLLLGLSRVVFSMSRDGLLPRGLSKTSSTHGTPMRLQIGAGALVAIVAGVLNVNLLEEMINIGTLSAFVLVSFAVPVMRRRRPDLQRSFRTPWSPVLPIISGLACIWLAMNLSVETWLRFVVWLVIGMGVYFGYSRRHSRLGSRPQAASDPTPAPANDPAG